jgi:hypothetical protein
MFQSIVYEDPIPTRLLLTHHSTRPAVPAWRYDSSHLCDWGSRWLALLQFPLSPELRAEAQEEEATAFPPSPEGELAGVGVDAPPAQEVAAR